MSRFVLFGLIFLLSGCYYDVGSKLYPAPPCTTLTAYTYKTEVAPILNTYCNNCHSGKFASAGIVLDNYTDVKAYVDNGKLLGTIEWTGGVSPMPKGGSKLSSCNIGKVKAWIEAGAQNN
ncbi:MAG: hypothetical protein U0V64_12000 [Cyclobacteriaceae bacterium]